MGIFGIGTAFIYDSIIQIHAIQCLSGYGIDNCYFILFFTTAIKLFGKQHYCYIQY